jgi:hypothetical protein
MIFILQFIMYCFLLRWDEMGGVMYSNAADKQ